MVLVMMFMVVVVVVIVIMVFPGSKVRFRNSKARSQYSQQDKIYLSPHTNQPPVTKIQPQLMVSHR